MKALRSLFEPKALNPTPLNPSTLNPKPLILDLGGSCRSLEFEEIGWVQGLGVSGFRKQAFRIFGLLGVRDSVF